MMANCKPCRAKLESAATSHETHRQRAHGHGEAVYKRGDDRRARPHMAVSADGDRVGAAQAAEVSRNQRANIGRRVAIKQRRGRNEMSRCRKISTDISV